MEDRFKELFDDKKTRERVKQVRKDSKMYFENEQKDPPDFSVGAIWSKDGFRRSINSGFK